MQELEDELVRVKDAKEKLEKEFDAQRAKFKQIYKQKELKVEEEVKAKEEQIQLQAERIEELSKIVQGILVWAVIACPLPLR